MGTAIVFLVWLVAILLLVVAPASLLSLKIAGVIPAPWEQVRKHCVQSLVAGAVLLCLAIYLWSSLLDALAPLGGH
jgi:hypothetical protein